MVTQFCELYPQHRTAVSASPVTVGALDHVRYPEQSGGHTLIESFTARDPFVTLMVGMSPLQQLTFENSLTWRVRMSASQCILGAEGED
jgi:hypothetical protein